MYWHIDADIFSLIIMTAIYVYYIRTHPPVERNLRVRGFIACFLTGICIALIDIAASVVMDVPTNRFLYHLLMTLYMISIEMIILAWYFYALSMLYPDNEKRRKTAMWLLTIPYALYALLVLSNPLTGLMFSLDADMVYTRGPCFMLMVVLYAIYALALIIEVIVNWKRIPAGYSGLILLMTPVILAVSIAVQLLIPGWLVVIPGYTVCLVMAFLFLQTRESQQRQALVQTLSKSAMTDKLTGLYNRTGAEIMVRNSEQTDYGKNCLVLVADLDDLKSINDAYGHAQGDRALQAIAAQMKAYFRATDIVSRFGGDEFVAYLVGNWTEEQALRSLTTLVERLDTLRVGEHNDVPIHGSIGAVIGLIGQDDFYTLCDLADAAMYYVKRTGKCGFAMYRPGMETEAPNAAESADADS